MLVFAGILNAQDALKDQARDLGFQKEEAAQLLSEYIQHTSITGNEKGAGEYLANLCREKGLHVRIFTDDQDSYNFAASLYPLESNKPNIILLNHIDVVDAGEPSKWIHPPYSGAVIQDTLWGRGAIDMKSVAIMQLMAASSFTNHAREADLPVNVTLLCVSGEEQYGMKGSKVVSESFLDELNSLLVLGEGGIGTRSTLSSSGDREIFFISTSDKRALWVKLHLDHSISGHGSVPPPDYANKMMIGALNSLTSTKPSIRFNPTTRNMLKAYGDLERGLKRFILKRPGFFKPIIVSQIKKDPMLLSTVTNTVTVTRFQDQKNEVNQIPQEITVMLDCRLIPETHTEEFLEDLRQRLNNNEIEISVVRETQNASPTVPDRYYEHFKASLMETYPDAGVIPVLFPATTDNNYFRNKGIPVYGIVPALLDEPLLRTIHNYNERIPLESVVLGAAVYRRFLESVLFPE